MRGFYPLLLAVLLTSCAGTSTDQAASPLIGADDMAEIGATAFDQLKSKEQLSADYAAQSHARCVADHLIAELPATEATVERWETQVFAADSVDALALPGGKIGIHNGMFGLLDSEGQLAAVVAHELGHLIEGHAARRVSTGFSAETAIGAVQTYRGPQGPQVSRTLYALLGLGSQVGIALPYTSADEAQADAAGLALMARAGYDPNQALLLWQNLELQQRTKHLQWLDKHPDPAQHQRTLRAAIARVSADVDAARRADKQPDCPK